MEWYKSLKATQLGVMRIQKFLLLMIGFLHLPGSAIGSSLRTNHISFRYLGLARHLVDVRQNAPFYPVKIDEEAVYVFNPGVLVAYDLPLNTPSPLYLRSLASLYLDCAAQPAGYVAAFIYYPEILKGDRWSVGSGFGLALNVRRSWRRNLPGAEGLGLFLDWGAVEAIYGPYSEVEILYQLTEKMEFVFNIMPGLPVVLFFSAGIRIPIE